MHAKGAQEKKSSNFRDAQEQQANKGNSVQAEAGKRKLQLLRRRARAANNKQTKATPCKQRLGKESCNFFGDARAASNRQTKTTPLRSRGGRVRIWVQPGFELLFFSFSRVELGFELLEEFEFQGSEKLNLGSTRVLIGFHSTWVQPALNLG